VVYIGISTEYGPWERSIRYGLDVGNYNYTETIGNYDYSTQYQG